METLYPNLYRTDPSFIDAMKYGKGMPIHKGNVGTLYGIGIIEEDEDRSSWLME